MSRRRLMTPLFEDITVGIDSVANELAQRLTSGEPNRSIVSLVGMGGIGKTTLAKKVYNNEAVIEHFDFRGWFTVTESYKIEKILKLMTQQIFAAENYDLEEISALAVEELASNLRQRLRSKRYVLVFDDVWDEDFWQFMRDVLPDGENGSRIMVTTRSNNVAACKESSFIHVHNVEPLSEEMSLELFCSKAFRHGNNKGICPPQLRQMCLYFISICEGLPLAIVAVAAFLSAKEKKLLEWRRIADDFLSRLGSDPQLAYVLEDLALSLRDLPRPIESCFLYFSIFPKDFMIPYDKLVKLWIAEGFIPNKKGKKLEDIAEEYLSELIQRNLVQPCVGFYGLEKFCRVHSLMHKIATQKAAGIGFCRVRDEKISIFSGTSDRLSVWNRVESNVLDDTKDSQVRSVFLVNIGAINGSFFVKMSKKYKYLTMLDCENAPLKHLPYELGNLVQLKYLNLRNTKVKELPNSVGKLTKLQTLDLRNTQLVELPMKIIKFKNLRHLLASGYDSETRSDSPQGVKIKEGIGSLVNLQTLMTMDAQHSGFNIVEELEKLRELRRLGISRLTTEAVIALCATIQKMSELRSLSLCMTNNEEILDLKSISHPPPLLDRLVLQGRLQKYPHWISNLQNLSTLCLSRSRLTDDPLKELRFLPNLECLWLFQAYKGKKFHFEEGCFPKLKLLVLRELYGLEVVEIEDGALPLLEQLRIGSSPLLNEVPSGFQYLRNLKVLVNCDMPNEFSLSMNPHGGSAFWKVKHVPCVLFWYRDEGRRFASYQNGESNLLYRLQNSAGNAQVAGHNEPRSSSFYYSDVEEDSGVARFSFSSSRNSSGRLSFSTDFYTDDIEE